MPSEENSLRRRLGAGIQAMLRSAVLPGEGLLHWRERIVAAIYSVGVVGGVLTMIPLTPFLLDRGQKLVVATDFTVLALLAGIFLGRRRLGYPLRAGFLVVVTYGLGVVYLQQMGLLAGGMLWLFAAAVLAVVLLGLSAAVVVLVLNFLTLVAFAWCLDHGYLAWARGLPDIMRLWTVVGYNFFLLSAVVTASVAVLARGMEEAWREEQRAREKVARERDKLDLAFQRLRGESDRRRQSQEEFRAAFDSAPIGMLLVATDRRILRVNKTLEDLLGYREDELVGRSFNDFTHPDDRGGGRSRFGRILSGAEQRNSAEKRYLHKSGQVVWVLASNSLVRDENGQPLHFVCHLQNITERKEAEEKLHQSEARYRSLVEDMPYGLFLVELPSGRFLFLNSEIQRMFGFEPGEPITRTIWDVIAPRDHELVAKRFAQRLAGQGVSSSYTYTAFRKDGTPMRVEATVTLTEYNGKMAAQGFARDITAQENLQKQLEQAQKMEAVGTLAGGVAHEFNNILMAIRGYSQLLAGREGLAAPHREHLTQIDEATKRASDLVESMLNFSRLEGGGVQAVEPNRVVQMVARLLERTLPPNLSLQLRLGPELPLVMANPHHLEQILLNLAVNARDAMPDGGVITIRTGNLVVDEKFLRGHPWARAANYDWIAVEDQGVGIPAEVLPRIFEPFFTTKEPGKGTGLGLSVAYSMIKTHQGEIEVDSRPGAGAVFTLYLPGDPELELPAPEESRDTPLPQGRGQRILVVDDEAAVRDISREALESFGYQVALASQGREALELYTAAQERGEAYDLVILDLSMPVMDGRQCLAELWQVDPGARVIVATGHIADHRELPGLGLEVTGVLGKPFDLAELLQEVHQALATPRVG
ncbi:MAG: PAS domain S-box protein [Deltaproteobacteria bacterium]|nr:PAS domain S-box protein [Deltaproteobacteria bacterium]